VYKAFVADDESLIIKSLKASVDWEMLGFEVIGEANDGIEAYELILELKPDIVFADIRMPGMTGLELIKKIGSLFPNTLFVIISGYAEFVYAQKALSYGALGYCLKPFDEIEIACILKRASSILEKLKASLEMELIGLLADTSSNAVKRIKSILDMRGFETSGKQGIAAVVSVGSEGLTIPSDINHIYLKLESERHAYLFPEGSLEKLRIHFSHGKFDCVKGIGFSKLGHPVGSISEAIEEACIAANQYFMTGKNGIYFYEDCDREELNRAFFQLEDTIVKKDVGMIQKALDMIEPILSKGVYNIKHAFQVYNTIMYSFCIMNSEKYERRIYDYKQLACSFDCIHDMFKYLKELLKEYAGVKTDCFPPDSKNETFRGILLYVNEHYCEDISIQTMSRKFAVNPSYVSQLFKKQIGTTFTEYITNLRVNYACNLLKTTGLAVTDVAEKTGFSDYYYFTRVFKKTVGETPTSFRERGYV
jgi:two-component system response regulator YesN